MKAAVNTPLPFVAPDDGVNVQLLPMEQDGMTVAPLIRLLNASRTVTVIVDAVEPATHPVEHAVIEAVPANKDD